MSTDFEKSETKINLATSWNRNVCDMYDGIDCAFTGTPVE